MPKSSLPLPEAARGNAGKPGSDENAAGFLRPEAVPLPGQANPAAAPDATAPESVAGEEDPGAAVDAIPVAALAGASRG